MGADVVRGSDIRLARTLATHHEHASGGRRQERRAHGVFQEKQPPKTLFFSDLDSRRARWSPDTRSASLLLRDHGVKKKTITFSSVCVCGLARRGRQIRASVRRSPRRYVASEQLSTERTHGSSSQPSLARSLSHHPSVCNKILFSRVRGGDLRRGASCETVRTRKILSKAKPSLAVLDWYLYFNPLYRETLRAGDHRCPRATASLDLARHSRRHPAPRAVTSRTSHNALHILVASCTYIRRVDVVVPKGHCTLSLCLAGVGMLRDTIVSLCRQRLLKTLACQPKRGTHPAISLHSSSSAKYW